jgi:signal transduction histidine kinase
MVLYEGRLSADRYTTECTPRDIVELIIGSSSREQVTPVVWALESFHAAQRQTEELYRAQAALHQSLEASDSQNRQLVKRLSEQVTALDRLNSALQDTQRRLMTESEEERKALARELHDQVIQDLLSFNYRLEDMESSLMTEEQRAEFGWIRSGIREVVSDLRQLCQDLRPPTIDNHGLPSAIRSLTQEWAERNNVRLQLNIDPELGRLPEAIELSVFRIVQEGLNNVRKHADATNIQVTLHRTPMDSLLLQLIDDGNGIPTPPDLASLSANKHFGWLGISERAALLGGSMEVQSPPEGGLVLQVEIPSPYPSV